MEDREFYRILQRLAEIDSRFLHEALTDYKSALTMYGFQPTEQQQKEIERYREGVQNKTDDEILVQLRTDIQAYKP